MINRGFPHTKFMIRTEKFPAFLRVYVYDATFTSVVHQRDWPLTCPPMMAIAETMRGVRTPLPKKKQRYTIPPPDPRYPTRTMPRYRGPLVHDDDCLCNKCVAMRAEPEQVTVCKTKPTKKQIHMLVERFRTS